MQTDEQNLFDTEDHYDYNNSGWPRDFDIRIEVAEQQEVLVQDTKRSSTSNWHCSEYDF